MAKRIKTNVDFTEVQKTMQRLHPEDMENTAYFLSKHRRSAIEESKSYFYKTFEVEGKKTELRLHKASNVVSKASSKLTR